MAITTLDGALAGMQPPVAYAKAASGTLVAGRPHSYWVTGGFPPAGTYDTTLNGANCAATITGRIPRNNPGGGQNAHVARFSGLLQQSGILMLCDRLWQNRIANATGVQSITQPTLPARSADGTSNGEGVHLALELSSTSTAGTPTANIVYTNQAGTGSRTATLIDAFTATTSAGSFLRYALQANDSGVRSVQSIELSATLTGGVCNIIAYRPIATLEVVGNVPFVIDSITGGFPRLFNDTVLFLVFIPNATTTTTASGVYLESHG